VWSVPAVRMGFVGMAVIHFFFMPMIYVGLPVLANQRFSEGAYVYGLEMAAYGGGAFIGAALGGWLAGPKDKNIIPMIFAVNIFSGSTLALVIFYEPYWWAMLLFFLAGLADNYFWVHFATWLQKKTPSSLLGRVMSLLMFMSLGLVPIADAVLGFAIDWNLYITMVGCSLILMIVSLFIALHPSSRKLESATVTN